MVAPALIPLAITLAEQFIPSIVKKITGDNDKEQVAEKVINVAKSVTGYTDPEQALKQAQIADDFKDRLLDEFVDIARMETDDIQDARSKHHHNADKVITSALYVNPILIVAAIAGLIYTVGYSSMDSTSMSVISTVIGGLLNQLYQERQQAYSYSVGSSLGSKLKTMFGGK